MDGWVYVGGRDEDLDVSCEYIWRESRGKGEGEGG